MSSSAHPSGSSEAAPDEPGSGSNNAGSNGDIIAPKRAGRRKRPHVPPEQRKRVKIACENCRRFKLRCNGQTPCGRCAGTGKQCHYLEVMRPQAAAGSVQCLSAPRPEDENEVISAEHAKLRLLQDIFAKLHPEVPATDAEELASFHATLLAQQRQVGNSESGALEDNGDEDETLVNTVEDDRSRSNESHDHDEQSDMDNVGLDNNSPIAGASVTVVNQGKTHFEGKSSYWSFFNSVRQVVTEDDAEVHRNDEMDCDGSIHQFATMHFATDWKTAVLAALPPRGVVDFLASTFFRFAQANYFYIHPEIFSRKLTAFYNGTHEFESTPDASGSRRSNEFISVLFMVFAIGSQFADVGIDGGGTSARDSGESEGSGVGGWADSPELDFSRIVVPKPSENPGWRFYEVSRRLLPDVICSSSMTSVQVCVLQGIFLPSTSSRDAGYNLLGLALRMAVNMGMHRSFGAGSLHPHVRELRNRLWWSVYLAERLFSVEMGRPLSISDAEIDAPFPVDVPEWNAATPGQPPMNVDGLVAMAKLCRLFGKIVETVYCKPVAAAGAGGKDTMIRPKVFRQLKLELEQCRRDLPDHLKLTSSPSRSVAHLALTFEQGTILLTRSCLNCAAVTSSQSQATTTTTPVSSSAGGNTLREEATRFLRQQASDCMASAVESIRIMSLLRSRSLLCQFSFHDALYCSAALYVLLLVEKLNGLLKTSREPVRQGILVLLDLARGSEAAASSLRHIIRGFRSCGSRRRRTDRDDEDGGRGKACGDGDDRELRGRMAWKAWMAQGGSSLSSASQMSHLPATIGSSSSSLMATMGGESPYPQRGLFYPEYHPALTHEGTMHGGGPMMGGRRYGDVEMMGTPAAAMTSPSLGDEHVSDISDLQPFWIPEYPDFDILGRNLAGVLDLPS